jgi:hypothetical protein
MGQAVRDQDPRAGEKVPRGTPVMLALVQSGFPYWWIIPVVSLVIGTVAYRYLRQSQKLRAPQMVFEPRGVRNRSGVVLVDSKIRLPRITLKCRVLSQKSQIRFTETGGKRHE